MTQVFKYFNYLFSTSQGSSVKRSAMPSQNLTNRTNDNVITFVLTSFYEQETEISLPKLRDDMISCLMDCRDLKLIETETLEVDGKNKALHSDYYLQIVCKAQSLLKTRPDLEGHFAVCKSFTENVETFDKFDSKYRPWMSVEDSKYFYNLCRSMHDQVALQSVSFGTLVHPSHTEIHQSISSNVPLNTARYTPQIIANFYHDAKYAEINFLQSKTRIEIQYSSVRRIFMSGTDKSLVIYLEVTHPPFAFNTNPPKDWKDNGNQGFVYKERILTPWSNNTIEQEEAQFLKDVFGKSNILKLEFDVDRIIGYQVASRMHQRCGKIPVHWVLMNEGFNYDEPSEFTSYFNLSADYYGDCNNVSLPFNCGYLLNAIMQRNFVIRMQIGPENMQKFYRTVEKMHKMNPRCLEAALTKTLYLLYDGTLLNYFGVLITLFDYYVSDESRIDVTLLKKPRNTEMIRRVILTPTQTIFMPPEIMFSNRVLRMARPDYALKVTFRDENMQKLAMTNFCSKEIHESAIKMPMSGQFEVYTRKYELLGWSNSQLHDHSVWMYALDDEQDDVATIRKMMGDFSSIKTVSKYMARMGQCFTSTEETILVPNNRQYVKTVKDIEREDPKIKGKIYCFSDGIGKISRKLLDRVCEKIKVGGGNRQPCALQIRYAGYKGMLLLDTDLYNEFIVFRESMKKFPCSENENYYLEVVKYNKPTPVYLNRPMISILDQLGVPYDQFASLQDKMLKRATVMLLDEEKAANYLSSRCQLPGLEYKKLAEAAAGLTVDPFFRSMLLNCHKSTIAKIKTKCSYEIDMSKGRTMFGVMDEYEKLEYGQVFVQFSTIDPDTNKARVQKLLGKVMVTKNPCMQAGDIRIFKAVDVPELRHVVDCIVFPQKGKRPHPDEMAGSDLDGDEYTVIWDQNLFFSRNREPTNFPTPQGRQVERKITEDDIINFLIRYVRNDIVGKIANAHLAISDRESIFSPIAASLAQKYSYAVDFAKSGEVKTMDAKERPRAFPDFMDRQGKSYKSKRALGFLYRTCCQFEKITANYTIAYQNIKIDPGFIYDGWEEYLESAQHARKRYNALETSRVDFLFDPTRLLSWYGLKHEVEALTGNITKVNGGSLLEKEIFVIRQLVARYVEELWSDFEQEFEEEFEDDLDVALSQLNLNNDERHLYPKKKLQKASAWYYVTYGDTNSTILSFPWVVSKYLAAIKKNKSGVNLGQLKPVNPIVEKLNADLMTAHVISQLPPECPETREIAYNLSTRGRRLTEEVIENAKLAYRVLRKWAMTQRLLEPGTYLADTKPLHRLFSDYLKKVEEEKGQGQVEDKAIKLVLDFLSFCSYLPYVCDKPNLLLHERELLNSPIRQFGYRAMQAIHSVSVNNTFEEFGIVGEGVETRVIVEMEPFKIPIEFIEKGRTTGFIRERKLMKTISGVDEVQIRSVTDKKIAIITATGTITNVRFLEDYLTKEAEKLEEEI